MGYHQPSSRKLGKLCLKQRLHCHHQSIGKFKFHSCLKSKESQVSVFSQRSYQAIKNEFQLQTFIARIRIELLGKNDHQRLNLADQRPTLKAKKCNSLSQRGKRLFWQNFQTLLASSSSSSSHLVERSENQNKPELRENEFLPSVRPFSVPSCRLRRRL